MKIDFLEIINFRNMRSAALDFANRNFVALIGDNGSGKTTILESITKAFVPVLRAVNGEAVKQCDLSNTDIKEGTSSVAVTLGIDLEGAKYTWTNKRRKASIFPYDEAIEIRGQNGNDLKKLKQKYIECVTAGYLPLVLYYGTDRIIREVPRRGHIKNFEVMDSLRNCFDNVNYFRDFYDWFKTEEDIELRGLRENPDYKNPRLDCVRTALERMIPGYSNLRIELNPSRMLLTNSEGIDLQIDQLSGGYKAVLSVVADIAKRLAIANPQSVNPLEEEAVILIDELDLHLHPKWQNAFAEVIALLVKELGVNVLLTTHSPNFVLALDAYMRKYKLEEKSNFYQTEILEDGFVQYNCMDDDMGKIYEDFLKYLSEVKMLRNCYMYHDEEDTDSEADGEDEEE